MLVWIISISKMDPFNSTHSPHDLEVVPIDKTIGSDNNSSWPSNIYIINIYILSEPYIYICISSKPGHHWFLVLIMPCLLFGAMPLSELNCFIANWTLGNKFQLNWNKKNQIRKCGLQYVGLVLSISNECHCRALCKILKRLDSWHGCNGRTRFKLCKSLGY